MNVTIPIGKRINLYDLFKTDNIDCRKVYIIGFEIYDENNDAMRTVMIDPVYLNKYYTGFDFSVTYKKFDLNTTIGHFKFELITRMFEDHSFMSYFQSLETEKENKIRSMWISY